MVLKRRGPEMFTFGVLGSCEAPGTEYCFIVLKESLHVYPIAFLVQKD